jgi:error-prone DNA polymerase
MIYSCHTNYSLAFGTMKVGSLAEKAKEMGINCLCITEINNTSSVFDFIRECKERKIKHVIGIEFKNEDQWLYTCMAKNNEGFREINEFLSDHNVSKKTLPETPPEFSNVFVIYPFTRLKDSLKDYEWIGVRPFEVNQLVTLNSSLKKKLVAFQKVTFLEQKDMELHLHLRALGLNTLLSKVIPEQTARPDESLLATESVYSIYKDYPELLISAERILDDCNFQFDFKEPRNKKIFTTSRYNDKQLLDSMAMEGMVERYGIGNKEAESRVKKELKVINDLGFCAYFLITWDILRFTMSKGIYHVGRGSGGNSIVAYCLKITDIDPIELNLYFERFINPQRSSPPDFDLDFSWRDRDSVHEYVFKKYGNHAALLGAMNTFQDSSIVRELGKVYGMPKADIDAIVDNPADKRLHNDITEKIFTLGEKILDFPHLRSIHAGGVLVSELPVTYYTALDLPPKNLATTQWDMYVAESIGLDKIDILSQRGLGHIKECVEIVKQNKGIEIDVHQVEKFKKDPVINRQLKDGEAIGCFYIESPAMRMLLKKLRCDNYISLVAASSIIRPGVAQSGMMKEYILRFQDPSRTKYLHPVFEEHLGETYGVMVYQEDVIKIAHHFAGLSLADADTLRRAMSGKYRSKKEFARMMERFYENCREKGYADELAKEVWRQMASFAGYAFCKAHSASYAVESYQSLFLKSYYPREFYTAVVNNFGGFYKSWVYLNEAKRHGANVNLPDINLSQYTTTIIGDEIFLGWVHLKSLETTVIEVLLSERCKNGPYKDMFDFIDRVPIGTEQLNILIRSGAFRFTGRTKKELMWDQVLRAKPTNEIKTKVLFQDERKEFQYPPLFSDPLEDAYDEFELIGFPISMSRFDMLKTNYRGNAFASELCSRVGQKVRMVGELVTYKYVFTKKKETMHFACFLDMEGNFFDTTHFPDSLKKYPFTGHGIYLIEGKVVEEFGFASIEVDKMGRLAYRPDPRRG